ncbi:prepilin-type N-terminal cleavage/methylation domain-containing protein [Lysinibacillus sp. KU-BSD001]|uniref:prepilin-type N-terminal cleavage/methylation domain-containing protein n=1 Tax=Lysinibacillus sp. KU-BSD001 TaxID=3141328 RepID=UPI0036E73AD1
MIKNERGISLVEVLAVIVISSIIIIFLSGIILGSVNTHNQQLSDSQQIYDKMYALKLITKDLRKLQSPNFLVVDSSNTSATLQYSSSDPTISYQLVDGELKRGSEVITKNVDDFTIEKIGHSVFIEITDNEGTLTTEITLRGGN